MRYKLPSPVLAGLAGLFLLAAGVPAQESVVIFDSFTNVSPQRDPGDPLHATVTEAGGQTWVATPDTGFGNGDVTNLTTVAGHVAGVAFDPLNYLQSLVTVEGRVDTDTGWVGVGFSRTATGAYWSDAQLWMYLRPTGRLVVAANGTSHLLYNPGGTAPGFVAGGSNQLKLEYDRFFNSVRAWLNGVELALTISDLDNVGFEPDIRYAGFHGQAAGGGYAGSGVLSVDDFAVTVGGPNLPVTLTFEPIADAHTTENWPTTNYGFEDHLRMRTPLSGVGRFAYLKFNVSGVAGPVISARLKVRTQETQITSLGISSIGTNSWTEGGITWANQPFDFNFIRIVQSLAPNLWHEIDVTSHSNGTPVITGNGLVTFLLESGDDFPNQDIWSRESAFSPVLEITYEP